MSNLMPASSVLFLVAVAVLSLWLAVLDNAPAVSFVASLVVVFSLRTLISILGCSSEPCKMSADVAPPTSLSVEEWRDFPLAAVECLTHNTSIYTFRMPSDNHVLGIAVGQHISVRAVVNGKDVQRSYTPISRPSDKGCFRLLVKSYEKGVVSSIFPKLAVGDTISVRGPRGKFEYIPNMAPAIGLIAGGTGITPVYQIIHAVLDNPDDRTVISLVFANRTEKDMLLKNELEALAQEHPSRFKLLQILSSPSEDWNGEKGHISKEILERHLAKPCDNVRVLICGPPPMLKVVAGHLEEIGYTKPQTISKKDDQVFKF